jgi:hypothetical protein
VDYVDSSGGGSLDGTRPPGSVRMAINIKLPMTAI